jgi:uridine kinase
MRRMRDDSSTGPHGRSDARRDVLERLAGLIAALELPHPVRVAIDGPDAAGKTTLADELAGVVATRGRPVVRASFDGFHRPRADRYRRGQTSAEGYYRDAFDYEAVRESLLLPLGPGGDRRYRASAFDLRADEPSPEAWFVARADAIVLVDGVFLLRPELAALWDFRIFVRADRDELLRRACERDASVLGSAEAVRERYEQRYLVGQRLYDAEAQPERLADVVVENTDVTAPTLTP